MKFVKSSLAACAALISAGAFAAATTDENGLTPTLWYKFEGDATSYGSQSVTWNNLQTYTGYFELINGRKALKYNKTDSTERKDPYTSKIADFSKYFGGKGFTIATYCRMSSTKKRATISLGSLKGDYANHELLLATANDDAKIRLFYQHQNTSPTGQATVFEVDPGMRTDFHHYAITFASNTDETTSAVTNWTVRLYVDGADRGTSAIPAVPTKGGIQLFNVFDDNGTGYGGGAEGASIDDLRIYDQVLTEAQIKNIRKHAASVPDPKGRTPSVWLAFDGNMNSQGLSTLSWGDKPSKSDNYIQTRSGQALYYGSLAEGKHHDPYTTTGADIPAILGEDGFTIMTSARMGMPAKRTLFGLGSMKAGSKHELILAQGETLGQVVLVDAVKGAVTTVVSTNVSDCARVLHHYAVSVAKTEESYTATLYVDGVSAGSGTLSAIPSAGGLQFFNVFADDGSGYSGDLAGAAVDDFRVYTEVLDAETIADYAAEFPVSARKDENGSEVDVWMRFDGDYYYTQSNPYAVIGVQDGLSDVGVISATSWKGTYETSRGGRALKTDTDSYSTLAGIDFGDGDWTLFLAARAQTVEDGKPTCLWTFGKNADTANTLGFFSTADGLMVSTWSNRKLAADPIFKLTDARLAQSINAYALVYTKAAGTLELFLNGVSQGSVAAPGTAAIQGPVAWQLASIYDGVVGTLTSMNYTGAVDDFRLYKKALTAAQVLTIAAANKAYPFLDENCAQPAYWYMFNGNLNGEGSSNWTVEGGSGSVKYATETNGIQAFAVAAHATMPYGNNISYGAGAWTVVLRAMGEEMDNAVLMGLGDRRSSNALAFAMGGRSRFSVATWSYVDDNTDCPHTDLFDVYLPNAYRQYHDYALVYQPAAEEGATGMLTLYVDGKSMGTVQKTIAMDGKWQLGTIYSGPAGTGLKAATKVRLDDFRVYTQALTAAQIKTIADANPAWPYYPKGLMMFFR